MIFELGDGVVDRIKEYTRIHGGGTFNKSGDPIDPHTTGFVVGLEGFSRGSVEAINRADLEFAARAGTHIGTWVHPGGVDIDGVVIIPDKETATKIGDRAGQLAIYDLATGEVIHL